MNKILLLEDDALFSETIKEFLEGEGFVVESANNGETAINLAYKQRYSLYLLDVKVPLVDGFDFLKSLRESGDRTPAIFITSLNSKEALSHGFQSGCDDFLKKPFDLDELFLRIKAVLGRSNIASEGVKISNRVTLIKESALLDVNGIEHKLSPQESELLAFLAINRNRVIAKEEIYDMLWGGKENSGALRVYISKLKSLLGDTAIINIRGFGYQMR